MTTTTMRVRAWTNDSEHRFDEYVAGDALATPVDLEIRAEDWDLFGTLDKAWAIGNRMAVDANGKSWPAGVRSLSVADVVAIRMPGDRQWYWAVDRMGFRAVDPTEVCDCGKGSHCPEYGMDFRGGA